MGNKETASKFAVRNSACAKELAQFQAAFPSRCHARPPLSGPWFA
jgi:hypothetical protein